MDLRLPLREDALQVRRVGAAGQVHGLVVERYDQAGAPSQRRSRPKHPSAGKVGEPAFHHAEAGGAFTWSFWAAVTLEVAICAKASAGVVCPSSSKIQARP